MVLVQLCLPFSGQRETDAGVEKDKPVQDTEGSDNERSHEDQGTSNRTMLSGVPRLRNGGLDICFLNAAFVAFLKIYPAEVLEETVGERSDAPLVKAIQTVLSSSNDDGTTLVDVRRALHQYFPSSYEEKSGGGFAVTALLDLIKAVNRETGKNDRLKCSMVITEKQDNPAIHCDGEPRTFCRRESRTTLNLSVTPEDDDEGPTSLQWHIDCVIENMKEGSETIECGTCGINFVAAAVSEYEVMPEVFLIEFNGAPRSIEDVEAAIRWGDVTYRVVAMIHHGDNHYWTSLREGTGTRSVCVIAFETDC